MFEADRTPAGVTDELRLSIFRNLTAEADRRQFASVLAWLDERRSDPEIRAQRTSLSEVVAAEQSTTQVDEVSLKSAVVFVRTQLREREVMEWTQPLMLSQGFNFCGLVLTRKGGEYLALVQAIAEPGIVEGVQLGPSVQLGMSFGEGGREDEPYRGVFEQGRGELLFQVVHSEEGGRFFRDAITYAALLVDERSATHDDRFRWVPLPVLKQAIALENVVNIHARTILCTLW